MFCHLYKFKLATGFEIIPTESCVPQCSYYMDNGECSICKNVEISLLNKQKLSWNITKIIHIDNVELSLDDEVLVGAIKLIHPKYDTIWILLWKILDENNKEKSIYSIIMKSEFKFYNIEHLNRYLINKCKYDGRPLIGNDFYI